MNKIFTMNSYPYLCIVIPTFNRKKQLCVLLNQLKLQQQNDILTEIVVVVDGSTDGTFELLQAEFPKVHIVKGDGNWWFTRSLNEGCKYAVDVLKTKLILTLNDDVQIPDNYLKKIIQNYSESSKNSVIGSCSYSLTEPRMITFSGFSGYNRVLLKYYKYITSYTRMEPGQLKGLKPSLKLPTRGLLIPADILKSINYLDEKTFPQYASDYDMVLRAAQSGANVFISYDAYLFEDMDLTSKGNPRLTKTLMQYLKNIFFNKYSANYFFNGVNMAWRYGIKLFFPLYLLNISLSVFYVYFKYKFIVNKRIEKQN